MTAFLNDFAVINNENLVNEIRNRLDDTAYPILLVEARDNHRNRLALIHNQTGYPTLLMVAKDAQTYALRLTMSID